MNDNTKPGPIKYFNTVRYERRVPTLLSTNTSGFSEIAKWVLDLNQILNRSCSYPPIISDRKRRKIIGSHGDHDTPVYIQTDRTIYDPESIVLDFDNELPETKQLFPTDAQQLQEAYELYKLFTTTFQKSIEQYRFTELFGCRKHTLKLLKKEVSFFNKIKLSLFYGSFKNKISSQLDLNKRDSIVFLVEIQKVFKQVSELLSDERKYLVGDSLSAADIAFAAIAAPLILPEEYGGAQSDFNQIAEEYRQEVLSLRATPAGQFVLRIYQEDRPINLELGPIPKKPGFIKRFLQRVIIKLTSNQGALFYWLQKRLPLIKIGLAKIAIASRHDLVVDILDRDEDFTVKEINAKKMADQKGMFFLGMDKDDPQFDRERNFVRKVAYKEDVERIQLYVKKHAEEICNRSKPYGQLDVVQSLNYNVLLGVLDDYFGVPAPVKSQMKKWQRTMFYDLFLKPFS